MITLWFKKKKKWNICDICQKSFEGIGGWYFGREDSSIMPVFANKHICYKCLKEIGEFIIEGYEKENYQR